MTPPRKPRPYEPTADFRDLMLRGPAVTRIAFPRKHRSRLTITQRQVLVALRLLGALPLPDLAAALGYHGATVSKACDKLIDRGWAVDDVNLRDRMKRIVALEPVGEREADRLILEAWAKNEDLDKAGIPARS